MKYIHWTICFEYWKWNTESKAIHFQYVLKWQILLYANYISKAPRWCYPAVKNPPADAGDVRDTGSIPVLGKPPGEGHGNPLQYSCWDNQRSLAGYSPWGCKESDSTEDTLHASTHISITNIFPFQKTPHICSHTFLIKYTFNLLGIKQIKESSARSWTHLENE